MGLTFSGSEGELDLLTLGEVTTSAEGIGAGALWTCLYDEEP
jgi:hypothetical protein